MSAHVPVNNVIPFSLVDGPGARCSIFLQGCNIHCAYCHNPETQRLCMACGECVRACPAHALAIDAGAATWDADACCACDTCIGTCRHRSSPRIRHLSAEELFAEARVIVTEGRNDPEDDVRGIAATVGSRVGSTRLRLMRFRHFGVRSEMANAPSPTDERMASIEREARDLGFGEVVVS